MGIFGRKSPERRALAVRRMFAEARELGWTDDGAGNLKAPTMSAPDDADIEDVKVYAAHVRGCATCKSANLEGELCKEGGALWDAVCEGAECPHGRRGYCAECHVGYYP